MWFKHTQHKLSILNCSCKLRASLTISLKYNGSCFRFKSRVAIIDYFLPIRNTSNDEIDSTSYETAQCCWIVSLLIVSDMRIHTVYDKNLSNWILLIFIKIKNESLNRKPLNKHVYPLILLLKVSNSESSCFFGQELFDVSMSAVFKSGSKLILMIF